ncbi:MULTISPECIES: hypothetical protein [Streptomyces]|uniref:hypothetical protein n=1 Tax=Streptomyces lycopersici TaxID=2974589 RepID=UPI0021CE0549|nr:hypothetical protein [Streptomyces sp. NEAU-383]
MTPQEFVKRHGDPAKWCGQECVEYLEECEAARIAGTVPQATVPAACVKTTWSKAPVRKSGRGR